MQDAEALITAKNRVNEVKEISAELNNKWKKLLVLSQDKGRRLEQAVSQRDHKNCIEEAKKKLGELEYALQSREVNCSVQ